MEVLQGLIPILLAISMGCWAEKTKKVAKTGVKRDISYGVQTIPGVTLHAPVTGQGGGYAAEVVQHLGLIPNTQALDSLGGFTSQGGYGIYPIIAAPIVNYQGNAAQGVHQLDQGWKGIPSRGYGSIKHGHEIAQSLSSKVPVPVHENVYDVPLVPLVPAEYGMKAQQAASGYSQSTLIPAYSIASLTANEKGLSPYSIDGKAQITPVLVAFHSPYQGQQIFHQRTQPIKGYTFSTYHKPQTAVQNNYKATPLIYNSGYSHSTNTHQQPSGYSVDHQGYNNNLSTQKIQISPSGHGSIDHGHQLAKKVQFPSTATKNHNKYHNSYIPNRQTSFTNSYHGNTKHHNVPGSKKQSSGGSVHNYRTPNESKKSTSGTSYSNFQNVGEHLSYRQNNNYDQVPAHLYTADYSHQQDSSSRASSGFTSDYNRGQSSLAQSSSEHDNGYYPTETGHTNGHGGGQYSGDQKATSFQSFVIHTYPTNKDSNVQNNSYESDENYTANKHPDRTNSAESRYQN